MICPITNDWCRTNGCGEKCYKRDSLGYSTAQQHDTKMPVSGFVALAKRNYKSKDGTIKEGILIDGKWYAPHNDC